MCGIAGLIRADVSADRLSKMTESMAATLTHRGPDMGRVWLDADHGLALAHRRLSIQDLSEHGAQPMHSQSGRYVIVYNGEIYNFRELGEELASAGIEFTGHSDTEILLAAIERWGLTTAIERSIGMFAIALWDRETRELVLARDRFGEKPLYYGWVDGAFVFASEMKAISEIHRDRLEIDRDALTSYMRHGYIAAPRSIFQGIYKLPPASILRLPIASRPPVGFSPHRDAGTGLSPQCYWDVTSIARESTPQGPADAAAAADRLDALLHEIVDQQSIADVPLGTFLSGGIDSTLVTAIVQARSDRPIKTFTVGFDEGEFNEAEFAGRIARHLGTDHTEVYVGSQDCLDLIPRMSTIYDEPFSDSSQIPMTLIAGVAREQVTVCLSGDGGDELFAGYNRYLHAESLFSRVSKLPGSIRSAGAATLEAIPPGFWGSLHGVLQKALPSRFGPQANVGLKVQKAAAVMRLERMEDVYRYLMSYWPDPGALVLGGREPASFYHDPAHVVARPFIEQAMLWDQLDYLPGDNLTKVDRASMSVSLETRLPLLDQRLAEFSWGLPVSMRVRDGKSKWLLREVLYRYVPREMIERPKMGFSVPVGAWLRGPLRDWAEALLARDRIEREGLLSAAPIRKAWERHLAGQVDMSQPLWTVLMFQAWLDAYGSGQAPE